MAYLFVSVPYYFFNHNFTFDTLPDESADKTPPLILFPRRVVPIYHFPSSFPEADGGMGRSLDPSALMQRITTNDSDRHSDASFQSTDPSHVDARSGVLVSTWLYKVVRVVVRRNNQRSEIYGYDKF